MPQSMPHYNPWADDPKDEHEMSHEELLRFIHAGEKVVHEKRRLRAQMEKSRQGVVQPPRLPRY